MTEFVEPNRPKIRPLDFLEPGRMLDLHAVEVPQLRHKRVGIIGTLSLMDPPDLEHVRKADWAWPLDLDPISDPNEFHSLPFISVR